MLIKRILLLILLILVTHLPAIKVGYALSGGGARGFAHIGILRVLEEEGIRPDYIAGTSSGAMIGALYSMGYNTYEIESIVTGVDWNTYFDDSYKRKNIYIGQKRWAPYGNISFEMNDRWKLMLPTSVFTANRVNIELANIFADASGAQNFDDLPIPFACVATDLISGEPVIFRSGSLMQAVRASLSVPSIIKPFENNNKMFIDGGVSQNLPIDLVSSMGADLVIGLKVNSKLRDRDELDSFVAVLDQTINVGMTRNVSRQNAESAIIFEPELKDYTSMDFEAIKEIIKAGEDYAREHLAEIKAVYQSTGGSQAAQRKLSHKGSYLIHRVEVVGNLFISDDKVKEYLGVETGLEYSIDDICNKCYSVWNSQYFSTVYPVLVPDGKGWKLEIHVSEKDRKQLAFNVSYTGEDNLVTGAILRMNNLFLRNSSLLTQVNLGGKNELNIDYVKNFGDFWGVYYRVFPYINEKTTYIYDAEHYKTDSVKSLEYGFTSGVGFLAGKFAIAEAYLYSSQTRLYRDISQSVPLNQSYRIGGLGLKLYHESLDDYVFPTSGFRAMGKVNFSQTEPLSNERYTKLSGELEFYHRYSGKLSLKLALEYGSYEDESAEVPLDPFYLGGLDGYYGYDHYEVSAPFYKIYEAGVIYSPQRNIKLGLGVQGLNYDDRDIWTLNQNIEYDIYASFGYRSVLGPLRFIVAYPPQGEIKTYLAIGFSWDIFKFSRR